MSGGGTTAKPLKAVKSILVSQPEPENGKSPYYILRDDYRIKVDFRPFIHVEDVAAKEFRKERIYLDQYSAVILTSRNAIEHYFRMHEELRLRVSQETKYFCKSEAIALYLQKFIQYRKRKIFFGDGKLPRLVQLINKHKDKEKFLLPCSDVHDDKLPHDLEEAGVDFQEAVLYKTVVSDLSDLSDVKYDMLVFFSPSSIDSLYINFPDFEQGATRIAGWGAKTAMALEEKNLRLDIAAPSTEARSMTEAIGNYLKKSNF
jgi:uroporphyrinogen-III synthase